MTQMQTIDKSNLPAYLQTTEPVDNALAGGINLSSGLPRVSTEGKSWTFIIGEEENTIQTSDGQGPAHAINVVIVASRPDVSKRFYEGTYVKGQDNDISCFSVDGVMPDKSIDSPVCGSCKLCPNNAWGSGKEGRGKACGDFKRIVVTPVSGANGGVMRDPNTKEIVAFSLNVPATSLKSLGAYGTKLANSGIPPEAAITELRFDPGHQYPSLLFDYKGFIEEAEYTAVKQRAEDDDVKMDVNAGSPSEPKEPAPELELAKPNYETEAVAQQPAPVVAAPVVAAPVVAAPVQQPAPVAPPTTRTIVSVSEDSLEDMGRDALVAVAKDFSVEVPKGTHTKKLRAMIMAAQAAPAVQAAPDTESPIVAADQQEADAELENVLSGLDGMDLT